MNIDRHSRFTKGLNREAVCLITPCILRLVLAILAALVVVVSLLLGASTISRQTQAASLVVPSCDAATSGATRCRKPTLDITKIVDPSNPEVGGVVTISFIISGLGLKTLDVVLVQDVSGSMEGKFLEDSKDAARHL